MASKRMNRVLQNYLEQLYQEWEATLAQLSYTLSEADKLRLERLAHSLEQKIHAIEDKLNFTIEGTLNQKVVPEEKKPFVQNKSSSHLIDNQQIDLFDSLINSEKLDWRLPRLYDMLMDWERHSKSDDYIIQCGRILQETLASFNIPVDFEGAYKGARITCFLFKPGYKERMIRGEVQRAKIQVSKIAARSDDLALALAAPNVRIEAPVPGTNWVGIEIPNQEDNVVGLKELIDSEKFEEMKGKLNVALGEDVKGQPIIINLENVPYFLIAGETGSGKSTCLHSMVSCLLLTHTPDTLRLLMIDLKMVDLNIYNSVPHLLSPVITEVDKAVELLFSTINEMKRRYKLFSESGVRNLTQYNNLSANRAAKPLPFIVLIIDEVADLMTTAPEQTEKSICHLAQMARATGIFLIISTRQIVSSVITKQIKANFPARIAFAVTHQADSRLILDVPGAEQLLSQGDMLFRSSAANQLVRIQGAYISELEISKLVRYWKPRNLLSMPSQQDKERYDERFEEAVRIVQEAGRGSVSLLQRKLQLGYSRAMRLMDQLEEAGILGPNPGNGQGREVLANKSDNQILSIFSPDANLDSALLSEATPSPLSFAVDRDERFEEAIRIVQEAGRGSVSLLQRKLRIGYSRAMRLVDQLEEAGILGPDLGNGQGREVLIDK